VVSSSNPFWRADPDEIDGMIPSGIRQEFVG
jgi:hypothetical protein